MSTPNEDTIRDRLSVNLDIIEPGLALIEMHHKLPNDNGAKGFIDILARDKLGNLVIMELKRSDQTAREALFEILKYMPLFRQKHGTPAHRIRCFIVSTTWHELLVPYSEFRRLCETQTEGFRIDVDEAGNVVRSSKVTNYIEGAAPQPFRMHARYLYRSADERERALPILRTAYLKAGAEGLLLVQLDYRGREQRIIYPFGAYFVPTLLQADRLDELMKIATAELEECNDEPPNTASIRESIEDTFLAIVNESIGTHFRESDFEFSNGSPDSFSAMVEGGWSIQAIERVGPFASTEIMTDADVIALIKGDAGESNVRYSRLGSPKHKLDWAEVREGARNSLIGNPAWEAGFAWFLDRVEKEFPDGTACLNVYNPLMFFDSLYRFAAHDDWEYIPQLTLLAVSADGARHERLVGTIVWNGRTIPKSIDEVFAESCVGRIFEYYMHKVTGTAWNLDEELIDRHGLEYGIWWLSIVPGSIEERRRMALTSEGKIEESPDQSRPASLTEFCVASEPYLTELFATIDSCVSR